MTRHLRHHVTLSNFPESSGLLPESLRPPLFPPPGRRHHPAARDFFYPHPASPLVTHGKSSLPSEITLSSSSELTLAFNRHLHDRRSFPIQNSCRFRFNAPVPPNSIVHGLHAPTAPTSPRRAAWCPDVLTHLCAPTLACDQLPELVFLSAPTTAKTPARVDHFVALTCAFSRWAPHELSPDQPTPSPLLLCLASLITCIYNLNSYLN